MIEIPEGDKYVYRHIRLDTNVPFYVGIGVRSRPNEKCRRNKLWNRIYKKIEGNYVVHVLFEEVCDEFAKEKEMELIALYGRIDKGTGTLANLTDGGEGAKGVVLSEDHKQKFCYSNLGKKGVLNKNFGRKHSDEIRARMSAAQMGNTNGLGKTTSEETKKKMSLAAIGRKQTQAAKDKISKHFKGRFVGKNSVCAKGYVLAYDRITGDLIHTFETLIEAGNQLGINFKNISSVILGRRGYAGDFIFRRTNGYELTETPAKNIKDFFSEICPS